MMTASMEVLLGKDLFERRREPPQRAWNKKGRNHENDRENKAQVDILHATQKTGGL